MKRISTLFLLATLGLAAGAVQAAQPDAGLTGCAATPLSGHSPSGGA